MRREFRITGYNQPKKPCDLEDKAELHCGCMCYCTCECTCECDCGYPEETVVLSQTPMENPWQGVFLSEGANELYFDKVPTQYGS